MEERVSVFGAGYVGLVVGGCLAASGHRVRVADVDRARIEALQQGVLPFYEPLLGETLFQAVAAGRLTFMHPDDLGTPDPFAFVAVGTPTASGGAADLRHVRDVIARIAGAAEPDTVVIMKSTIPPGTGAEFARMLAPAGVAYVSNPEFLREGSAVGDWLHPDRIVLGGGRDAVDRVAALYRDIDAPVVRCDISSAELVKYASNAFLATKISFTNEIAALCDLLDADVATVSEAVGLDRRIGSDFLKAGLGYGGSCFPKDTRELDFLSMVNGYEFHLLRAVIAVNRRQRILPLIALRRHFGSLVAVKVAVLGLTFKPETDDTREAPAIDIIEQLALAGADVTAYDPVGVLDGSAPCRQCATLDDAVSGCDAVVVTTEWPAIVEADWRGLVPTMAGRAFVFDGRNCLDPHVIREAGAAYAGIGRR